ncbi:MAG TPA: DNA-directed RNA polymerase subunit alpha C-terminal domain-containing protein [Candidatus Saccharimonadales bacterium]|nr:DNA-directed RNA polymerase subunit alpha C-terminal domain-containing protein [Candidatus Saccharimonadales bacterium]
MSEVSLPTGLAWTMVNEANAAFDAMKAADAEIDMLWATGNLMNLSAVAEPAQRYADRQRDFELLQEMAAPAVEPMVAAMRAAYEAAPPASPSFVEVQVAMRALVATENAQVTTAELRGRASMFLGGLIAREGITVDVAVSGENIAQESLDQPIAEVVENKYGATPMTARVINCMRREGVKNFRDLLVVGKETIGDIRNLGRKGRDYLQATLADIAPDITWLDNPTMDDIATYCTSPDQVTLKVLGNDHAHFLHGVGMQQLAFADLSTLMDAVVMRDIYDKPAHISERQKIGEEKRLTVDEVGVLQASAREFVAKFLKSRARLTQERPE